MARWRNKSIQNLLQFSVENNDHTVAAKEWRFSGNVIDHCVANQICQLCEGENLRYHFEISNKTKEVSLLVGSSCIKKFDISVYDHEGNELFGAQKDSFLKKKIQEKKQELLLEQLRLLWNKSSQDEREEIEFYVNDYKQKKGFSPEGINFIFSQMDKHHVEYTNVLYKISLRSQFELLSLVNMSATEQEKILPCLSVSQIKRLSKKKQEINEELKSNKTFEEPVTSEVFDNITSVNNSSAPKQNYSQSFYEQKRGFPPQKDHNGRSSKQKSSKKKNGTFSLPEFITCSICGEYTKEWVSFNPNKCRKCLNQTNK